MNLGPLWAFFYAKYIKMYTSFYFLLEKNAYL